MPEKIPSLFDALTILLGGGAVGAVLAEAVRQIGSRDKGAAEVRKLDAETEKVRAEAEAVLRSVVADQIKVSLELMRDDAERRNAELARLEKHLEQLWQYVETLRNALRATGASVPPAPTFQHGDGP